MTRLIDVKHFSETLSKCGGDIENNAILFAMLCLANAEAELFPVDAVPVIRCRECIHAGGSTNEYGRLWCVNNGTFKPTDGYCSDAKRRYDE